MEHVRTLEDALLKLLGSEDGGHTLGETWSPSTTPQPSRWFYEEAGMDIGTEEEAPLDNFQNTQARGAGWEEGRPASVGGWQRSCERRGARG